uniref:hypothetical protein n=1 Tax=Acinetobacter baumannii TaxID=470 RepID=UPI0033939804
GPEYIHQMRPTLLTNQRSQKSLHTPFLLHIGNFSGKLELFVFLFHDKPFKVNIIGIHKLTIKYRDNQMKETVHNCINIKFPKWHQYNV